MARKRVGYGFLLLALLLLQIFLEEYIATYLLLFFLLLPFLALILLIIEGRGIEVAVCLQDTAAQRKEEVPLVFVLRGPRCFFPGLLRVTLVVENTLFAEKQVERLWLPVCQSKQKIEQLLTSSHCGHVRVQLTEVRLYDHLGFFSRRVSQKGTVVDTYILPAMEPLALEIGPQADNDLESDRFSKQKPGDDPAEVFDIRPYRAGDQLPRVHWKLSSKADTLLVREYSLPLATGLLLVVDGKHTAALDAVMDTAASLLSYCEERELPYALSWCGKDMVPMEVPLPVQTELAVSLGSLLAAGDAPLLPLMEGENSLRSISHTLYLCWQPAQETVAALEEAAPRSKLTVLQLATGETELPLEVERIFVDPTAIAQSLSGLVL